MLDPALSVRHPVVTKMRIERFFLYKKNGVQFDTPIDKDRLQRQEGRWKYSEQLRKEFEETREK